MTRRILRGLRRARHRRVRQRRRARRSGTLQPCRPVPAAGRAERHRSRPARRSARSRPRARRRAAAVAARRVRRAARRQRHSPQAAGPADRDRLDAAQAWTLDPARAGRLRDASGDPPAHDGAGIRAISSSCRSSNATSCARSTTAAISCCSRRTGKATACPCSRRSRPGSRSWPAIFRRSANRPAASPPVSRRMRSATGSERLNVSCRRRTTAVSWPLPAVRTRRRRTWDDHVRRLLPVYAELWSIAQERCVASAGSGDRRPAMRVTHLGKFYPPVPGGMERVLQSLCEGERERGVDSRALVVGTGRATVTETINGVPVTRGGIAVPDRLGLVCAGVDRAAEAVGTDILVLHEPNPMALLAYAMARPRHRLVIWYHSEVIRRAVALQVDLRAVPEAADPACRAHHRVLARTDRARRGAGRSSPAVRGRCPSASTSTGPIVPAAHPSVAGVRAQWRGSVALFVGRLVPYKGVDVLLQALRDVDVAAVIIGDGPLRARLGAAGARARRRRSGCSFPATGRRGGGGVVCGGDMFVLPSVTRAEAFGLVQLEAMARGTPVISTRLPTGVPWVNVDGVTGIVVPPGDRRCAARGARPACR